MSIFRIYTDYLEYKSKEWEEFLRYLFYDEYTDVDTTINYDPSEYTIEVGDDELPFYLKGGIVV